MNQISVSRPIVLWVLAAVAIVFGVLTIKSAYLVLFTTGTFHQQAGNYLPLVVWFNGIAGFLYVIAGLGLFKQKIWAVRVSIFLAISTLTVFALFGMHVSNGGLYEHRTVGAMSIRSALWIVIALVAWFKICKNSRADSVLVK